MQPLEWADNSSRHFIRGQITEYNVAEMTSGAVAINIVVRVDDYLDDETNEWVDCSESEWQAKGAIWIIGRDKKLNPAKVESLKNHAGWDGDMTSLDGSWKPTPCSFTHEFDTRNGEWVTGFINAYDDNRAGKSTANLQDLQNRYGSQLRAIAGNVTRNAAPPKGKPRAPVAPKTAPAAEPLLDEVDPEAGDDDIPF